MKSIYHFIIEKLQLNTQSKLKDWSIEDAKDGDIITYKKNDIYIIFIFNILKDYNKPSVELFAYVNYDTKEKCTSYQYAGWLFINDMYGDLDEANFYLSTKKEKQLLFNNLKKRGYKWNDKKKEIEHI